jgi:hypothetical protein
VSISSPPEYALLLDAITPAWDTPRNRVGWDDATWDRVLRLAAWHRLSPMLYRHLSRRRVAPSRVVDALEEAYFSNAARNLFIGASLRRVLEALADAKVPAMPLKGAALFESDYPDPALREMLDLDILVPSERLDAANTALAAIGYRPLSSPRSERETRAWMRVNHHHDPALVDDHQIAAVELHHHIAMAEERKHFDIAGKWERARPTAGPPPHLLPSREDLLLHVCLHFTRSRLGGSYRHGGSGGALAQLSDIAWIIGAPGARRPLDWDALITAARLYRIDARVFLALFAAHELGVAGARQALREMCPPGFDPRLGRRLVALRVLRGSRGFPVRRLSWMVAPSRDVLAKGWRGDPRDPVSLVRAYVRRARAQAPVARAALKNPWSVVQDYRLNDEVTALEQTRARRELRAQERTDANSESAR